MRVGLLTSYRCNEIGTAWITLPLMRQYVRARGYTLAVGEGMSADGMFERFGDQFETAMLFIPITFVITDPLVPIHHLGKRQTEAPAKLGVDCWGCSLEFMRWLGKRGNDHRYLRQVLADGIIDREDLLT